jgi:hypothetical protein
MHLSPPPPHAKPRVGCERATRLRGLLSVDSHIPAARCPLGHPVLLWHCAPTSSCLRRRYLTNDIGTPKFEFVEALVEPKDATEKHWDGGACSAFVYLPP